MCSEPSKNVPKFHTRELLKQPVGLRKQSGCPKHSRAFSPSQLVYGTSIFIHINLTRQQFYSSFILDLSQFHPSFIFILVLSQLFLVLSQFYLSFILVLSQFYSGFILVLSQFYPSFILVLSQYFPSLPEWTFCLCDGVFQLRFSFLQQTVLPKQQSIFTNNRKPVIQVKPGGQNGRSERKLSDSKKNF